ncbi:MAG: hypothetical protein ACYTGQ_16025 [Planctomycetota bacterium]|jgi:hypothetical protein
MTPKHPNAFVFIDTVTALVLAIFLTVMTTHSFLQQRQLQTRLADQRQAARIAERVLVDLQLGQTTLEADPDTRIGLERLEGGYRPDGRRWVRVTVEYREQEASLTGLTALNPVGANP